MDENERDGQNEQMNDGTNSGVAAANTAGLENSESDTANKTPPRPRSSDEMFKAVQMETPYRCIRECLEKAFDALTIRIFCSDHFHESVHNRIEARHGFDEITLMIIDHCKQHDEMELFWQAILQDRPKWHIEYYVRWKKADEIRWQKADERVSKVERVNASEFAFRPNSQNKKMESTEHNPLDKNLGELTRWFFKELQQNERSLLLTAALFEGMSRQKMLQVDIQLNEVFSDKK